MSAKPSKFIWRVEAFTGHQEMIGGTLQPERIVINLESARAPHLPDGHYQVYEVQQWPHDKDQEKLLDAYWILGEILRYGISCQAFSLKFRAVTPPEVLG